MDFDLARHNMVVDQLEERGISDPRVLEAMEWVPRHKFVPEPLLPESYEDRALPIEFDQTISQPYTVAFMCEAARLTAGDKVLEIGTGSGYCAAVLSLLVREVHTIERLEPLYRSASERLAQLGFANVQCYFDDGTLGLPTEAPFNAIICTAGAESLPEDYQKQLADSGRIVIPVGRNSRQEMIRITRRGDQFEYEDLGTFGFVPLVADTES
jgi:protein-L-isoaspartate(D-aspartate) O-methyltransferase